MAVGILHADHVAPCTPKKLALTSPRSFGRPAGIVRSRIQATEFSSFFCAFDYSMKFSQLHSLYSVEVGSKYLLMLNRLSTTWAGMGLVARSHLGTSNRWVVSFMLRPPFPPGLIHRYPLGGAQSRSGRYGEAKIIDPSGTRTPIPRPYPIALPYALSRLWIIY
jgi:hypothetical protein